MERRRAAQGALLAVVLAVGVILGLLGMHALAAHGTAHPAGTSLTAHAATDAEAHDPPSLVSDCGGCAGEGSMWSSCVLALLVVGLLLALPRRWLLHGPASWRSAASVIDAGEPLPRPPSLDVLCISRR